MAGQSLPGSRRHTRREKFISALTDSDKKLRALRSRIFSGQTDPGTKDFHPLKAIVEYFKKDEYDEATWLAFLCIHFGGTSRTGKSADTVRLFYGKFGKGKWDWKTIVRLPADVREWMLTLSKAELKQLKFGNHRKYETNNPRSAIGTPAVIASFVEWVRQNEGDSAWQAFASAKKIGSAPEAEFDFLYESLDQVKQFGRTARFDFLCLLGNLGILDVMPAHCYLQGSTGPTSGALLLGTGRKKGRLTRRVQEIIDELRVALGISAEAMEDGLCNWQKGEGFISRMFR